MANPKKNRAPRTKAQEDVLPTTTDAIEAEMAGLEKKSSGDFVIVCLNRAIGVKFDLPGGREVRLPGNSFQLRGKAEGKLNTGGGYSMTRVKREDWDYIVSVYGETALFKGGRVFAAGDRDSALAEAREKNELRHGLEPTKGTQTSVAKGSSGGK